MAFRLHSRLIAWNVLIIVLVTFVLSSFFRFSELALVVVAAIARPNAAVVGDEQVDVPAPAQGAIRDQAVDGGKVVGFSSQAVVVEIPHQRIDHVRRVERVQPGTRWQTL